MQNTKTNSDASALFDCAVSALEARSLSAFDAARLRRDALTMVGRFPMDSDALSALVVAECAAVHAGAVARDVVLSSVERGKRGVASHGYWTFVGNCCTALSEIGSIDEAVALAEEITINAPGGISQVEAAFKAALRFGRLSLAAQAGEKVIRAGGPAEKLADVPSMLAHFAKYSISEAAFTELAQLVYSVAIKHVPLKDISMWVSLDDDDPDVGDYLRFEYCLKADMEEIFVMDDEIFEGTTKLKHLREIVGRVGISIVPKTEEPDALLAA